MKYWKTVELGDFKTYRHDVLDYFKKFNSHFEHINLFWHPLREEYTKKFLKKIPLLDLGCKPFGPINEITILIISKVCKSSLHVDHTTHRNAGVKARINVPILNCEGSLTSFFELTEEQFKQSKVNSAGSRHWPESFRTSIEPVTSVSLIQPTILRTSTPHTVFTEDCNLPRVSMTISFTEDVVKYLDD